MKRQIPKDGRYCAYLRKSRDDKDWDGRVMTKEETIRRHRAWLEEREAQLGIHVSEWYIEVVSGDTIEDRPIVQQVLAEVEDGVWDGVLCMDVQRLARGNTMDQGIMCEAFEDSGAFIITNDGYYDTMDEADMEYLEYGLYNARREYKTINRIQQNGRMRSRLEGNYIHTNPPYGYRKIKVGKNPTLEIVEEEAQHVRMMYEMAAAGVKCHSIALKLNDMGVPCPWGADYWTPITVGGKIQNEVYKGKIAIQKTKVTKVKRDGRKKKAKVRQKHYKVVDGKHEAIVSEELWERANAIAFTHQPVKRGAELQFAYSGIVECAQCGKKLMRMTNSRNGYHRLTHKIIDGKHCDVKSTRIDMFTEHVIAQLKDDLTDMEVSVKSGADPLREAAKIELESMRDNLAVNQRSHDKLLPMLLKERITEDEYDAAKKMLAEEKERLESRIAELEASIGRERPVEEFKMTVHHAVDMLNGGEATAEELNRFLKTFVKRITYDNLGKGWKDHDIKVHIEYL
ncbi:MAG: recombinase family protein [Clostridia bacterium]|nr:recombinase family protein [Clostridia bacterium]